MSDQRGFTLLELVISTALIGLLGALIGDFYVGRLIDQHRTFTQINLQTNTRTAIDSVTRDIKAAQAAEASNAWPDDNAPGAPVDPYSWTSTSASPATIVLAVPARDSSGNLLYIDPLHTSVHTNDVIYYIDGTTQILYRRVIANPVSGNAAVTTCPPANAEPPTCPADAKVVEDVADMIAAYYDNSGAVADNVTNASLVEVTIKQIRSRFGRTYTSSLTSQASLRNK